MPIIHLYHISQIDLGSRVLMQPMVPKFKTQGEDSTVPRICCCTSIPGCIHAITNIPELIDVAERLDLYAYEANVDAKYIVQPSDKLLPDVWLTGEMWVTTPQVFYKCHHYIATKQFHIPNTNFSRYAFKDITEDYEVVDRVVGGLIYGDSYSFSMVLEEINRETWEEAMGYYEEHPYF